jgi:hypothetical protein
VNPQYKTQGGDTIGSCERLMSSKVPRFSLVWSNDCSAVSSALANSFFGSNFDFKNCHAVSLEKGTHRSLVAFPVRMAIYSNSPIPIAEWIHGLQRVEIGFINYVSLENTELVQLN